MAELPFINKYGSTFQAENTPGERERCFVVLKKDNLLLCQYNRFDGLWMFPEAKDVSIEAAPTLSFILHQNIVEDDRYYIEQQTYNFYDIENVQVESETLEWCAIEDILLGKFPFTAEQKTGFKNLLVRVKK